MEVFGWLKWANSVTNSEDRGYLYDAAWNLNARTNNGSVEDFFVDVKNQLTNTTFSGPPGTDMIYDQNGNLTNSDGGVFEYQYDDENQLTAVVFVDDTRWSFIYDGLGRLKEEDEYTWNGTGWDPSAVWNYIYDGRRVIQDRSANTPWVSYTRGNDLSGNLEGAGGIGGLLARSHGWNVSTGALTNHNYYHADGNGNITYMVNSSQQMVASYRYDPFGNELRTVGSLSTDNQYRFSSKPKFFETFYYYGFRWYAANTQRWMNRDPQGEKGFKLSRKRRTGSDSQANLYSFVDNSPINSRDNWGLVASFGFSWWRCYKIGKCIDGINSWAKKCQDEVPTCDNVEGDPWAYVECLDERNTKIKTCTKAAADMIKQCQAGLNPVPPVEFPWKKAVE